MFRRTLACLGLLPLLVLPAPALADDAPMAMPMSDPATGTPRNANTTDVPVCLQIVSPKMGEVLAGRDVTVKLKLRNWFTGAGGPHVHLVLDDTPYKPVYDLNKPFVLRHVLEGSHTLRAFPSNAEHLSVKDAQAFAWVNFAVGHADGKYAIDPKLPILTYSRPKGDYNGNTTKHVLFDFWLAGAKLSPEGDHVRYVLDEDPPRDLTSWVPLWFTQLKPGEHKLSIQLVDAEGRPQACNYGHTERYFTTNP